MCFISRTSAALLGLAMSGLFSSFIPLALTAEGGRNWTFAAVLIALALVGVMLMLAVAISAVVSWVNAHRQAFARMSRDVTSLREMLGGGSLGRRDGGVWGLSGVGYFHKYRTVTAELKDLRDELDALRVSMKKLSGKKGKK